MIGEVKALRLIDCIKEGLDLCEIEIDFDRIKVYGAYSSLLNFMGKTVEYDTRLDVIDGVEAVVIANIANVYTIQTIEKGRDVKLIPKDAQCRVVCTFDVNGLRYGDMAANCIAFMSSYENKKSSKTKWTDCQMVDKNAKVFTLRIFTRDLEDAENANNVMDACVGHYARFNVTFTKYGYQSTEIEYCNIPVIAPPEVDIAISIINDMVEGDKELLAYMQQYDYVNCLRNIIDVEMGYNVVDVATEMYFIKAISDISSEYDKRTLVRAAVTSRGYLLPTKNKFSRPILNTNKVLRSELNKDKELLLILDVASEEEVSMTKSIYVELRKFCMLLLEERRKTIDDKEKSIDNVNNSLHSLYGGLL